MGITDKISHAAERKAFETIPDGKWAHYTQRLIRENDPYILKTFLTNVAYEGGFRGYQTAQETAEKYDINVPWLILMDPTSACNMHCTGCWAAEYGHKQSLTFEEMDRVLTEAKALGTHACLFTGGEPLLRKKDIIRLCEKHRDMAFHAFTNGTLIDEEFCQEMLQVGNFFVSISVEGFEEANDGRRGRGHFQKTLDAMDLMRSHRIPFGVSICYTSRNYKVVTSDEFLDLLISKGCVFAWYFHYIPVGLNADTSLLLTPEQRTYMKDRVREIRGVTGGKELYCIDFQNDGEFAGGCVAGGRPAVGSGASITRTLQSYSGEPAILLYKSAGGTQCVPPAQPVSGGAHREERPPGVFAGQQGVMPCQQEPYRRLSFWNRRSGVPGCPA